MSRRGARDPAWRPGHAVIPVCALLLGLAAPLPAQQVRATGTTTVRFLQIRPLEVDSVPIVETRGEGLLRRSQDGQVVRCVEGETFCRFLASSDAVEAAPVLQDLRLSVWGLGRGVRAYGHLRGRGVAGNGGDVWPLSGDHFDALAAWIEVERSLFRVRAGRQWKTSGLGYHNFDGISVRVRALETLTVELWGGRSLLRGTTEPRTGDLLAAVEPFAPDEGEILVGGEASWRPGPGQAVSALYQREIRRDRAGLYAERMTVDGLWRAGRLALTGTIEADLGTGTFNEARLDASLRAGDRWGTAVFARRHRPFFEAWTIWGAFAPVGFDEVGGRGWWRPRTVPMTVETRAAWRRYGDAHASTTFETYRDSGWRLSTAATLAPSPAWEMQLTLGTDVGFGAARDDATFRIQRIFGDRTRLAASAMAFERVYEFRVDEGTVWGAGVDGGVRITPAVTVDGRIAGYLHRTPDGLPQRDWSQLRGSLTARWTVGAEPGTSGGSP